MTTESKQPFEPSPDFKSSVVMTTYNGEAFVEQQIESILRQTKLPDELVVSDDYSTDRTIKLIEKATRGCPFPVRIFENSRNVGLTRNLENAITKATGDIIFPSDWDDYWLPERVAAIVSVFAESRNVLLAYCDAELTDSELRPSGVTLFSSRPQLRIAAKLRGAQALAVAVRVQGMSIAFHRNLMPFVLPFSDQCNWDRWVSLIASAVGEMRAVDRTLVLYRRHGKNWGPLEFEGGVLDRWIRAATPDVYAYRVSRWDAVHRRLQDIKASGLGLPSANRIEEFLRASEDCLRFACLRKRMKGRPRVARVWDGLSSLARGNYHRYADGTRSCILDLAAR